MSLAEVDVAEPSVISESTPETEGLFEEARRRRRRRRLAVGCAAVMIAVAPLAWWLHAGADPGRPPTTPNPPPASHPLPMPALPANATPVEERSVGNYTLRIFAWPTGLPVATVEMDWILTDPRNAARSSSEDKLGPSDAGEGGMVSGLGGSYGGGPEGSQEIEDYQVTSPSVATIRVVDGKRVLDSMAPVAFGGVRYGVLVALDVPAVRSLTLQALNASGAVVYSRPFRPRPPFGRNAAGGEGARYQTR